MTVSVPLTLTIDGKVPKLVNLDPGAAAILASARGKTINIDGKPVYIANVAIRLGTENSETNYVSGNSRVSLAIEGVT